MLYWRFSGELWYLQCWRYYGLYTESSICSPGDNSWHHIYGLLENCLISSVIVLEIWWFFSTEPLICACQGLPLQSLTTIITIMCFIYKCWILNGSQVLFMMTSSNGNIFCITGPLCGEFTSHWWIPLTKASDAELWCFLWSAPEQTIE